MRLPEHQRSTNYPAILVKLAGLLEKHLRVQSDPRILGCGDIFESFPIYANFKSELKGFKERRENNPAYLIEILVSVRYFQPLNKKQGPEEQQ